MKKLLLIALLTVAMVFTLVACTEEKPSEETTGETKGDTIPVTGDETEPETPAEDTKAPDTDPVDETDPPVEDTDPPVEETDPPVEETDPPAKETDPPVEETDPPVVDEGPKPWDELKDVVTHLSFDELRVNGTADGLFTPGQSAGWSYEATVEEDVTLLQFWGWIGIADAEVGLFGYQIDDNAPIYDAAWTHATGDDVIAAAAGTGAQTASRMLINIDLSKIAGEHTIKTLYKNAAGDKEVILAEFTITRNAPQILDSASAGMVAMNKDAESSDNYSASLAGWIGFGQPVTQLGYSVDGGAYVWLDGGINANPEDGVKAAAGEFAIRYDIKVDLTGVEFGEHEVVYVVRLEDRNICEFYGTVVITNDPSFVGDSTYDFDTANTPDIGGLFKFHPGLQPENCNYTAAPYKMAGINQLTLTAEGTFKWTVNNLVTADGHAALFVRGNPSPSFGDANYFGHDGNNDKTNPDSLSVGCAGIYFGIEEIEGVPYLRLNVKGNVDGKAIPHIFKVAMTSRDITVVDDNNKITFYNGETLLATVDLNGNEKGYATEAIVTLADGTTETLTDVCAAATAASDIGFIARSVDMTFDAVTLKNLGVEPEQPAGVPTIDGEPENPVKVVGAADLAAATGLNNVVITAGNGYTTFTFDGTVGTPGNDPYCTLPAGYDGARYVAVKYRAPEISANMNMQIYVGSGALANDDQSLEQVITADGEWHLLIFDLDELVTKMDANYHVNFLRLDALQAGIKYNEDGTPVVPNPEQPTTYEKLPIPDGASIDVAYIAFFAPEAVVDTVVEGASSTIIANDMLGIADSATNAEYAIKDYKGEFMSNKNLFSNDAMGADVVTLAKDGEVIYAHYALPAGATTPRILYKAKYMGLADNADYIGTQYLIFRYRTNVTQAGALAAGYEAGQGEGNLTPTAITWEADGEWHTYAIKLTAENGGLINVLNLWITSDATSADYYFDLDYIAFYADEASWNAAQGIVPAEDLTIDMSTLSGQAGYQATWDAAGISTPHVVYNYGTTINLGTLDLSKYSKVIISYCCDGSQATADAFAGASSLAIGLKSENSSYGQATDDNFSGDIAHTDMEFSSNGWGAGIRDAEVDLSAVDYNGNVWVALHNPAGTIVAVTGIQFIA